MKASSPVLHGLDPNPDGFELLPQQHEQEGYTRTDLNLSYTTSNGKYVVSWKRAP